jgi:hypothetical protein
LLAVEMPRSSPLEPPNYWVYLCDLKDDGKVRLADLVATARKHAIVEDCETIIDAWPFSPVPVR